MLERSEDLERSWLGSLATVLPKLQARLMRQLDRPPDTGDLLLALATVEDTRAAVALRALGVDLDRLAQAVAQARDADGPSLAELIQAIDAASLAEQQAAAARDYEEAIRLRYEQQRLHAELDAARIGPEVIEAIRVRLGLTPPPSP